MGGGHGRVAWPLQGAETCAHVFQGVALGSQFFAPWGGLSPDTNYGLDLSVGPALVAGPFAVGVMGGAGGCGVTACRRAAALARINHTFLKKSFCHRAHRGPNRGHGAKHLVRSVASVGWAPCPL